MASHVDNISATVTIPGGPKVSIHAFELVVGVNAIPRITLEALPVSVDNSGSKHFVTASTPSVDQITELYDKLSKLAVPLDKKCTVSLSIKANAGLINSAEVDGSDQSVELKDWILTDVGLSSVTTHAAPILTLILCHPAILLEKTGMFYHTITNSLLLEENYRRCTGDTAIDVMDKVYAKYAPGGSVKMHKPADVKNGGPSERYREKLDEIRTDLKTHAPSKYIKGSGGLFMSSISGVSKDAISESIAAILAPRQFGGSTWSRLIRVACPYLMATVVPTYTDSKLTLEPFSPWQKCKFTIPMDRTSAIDVPAMDPRPIIGVAVEKGVWDRELVVGGSTRTVSIESGSYYGAAFYIPEKAISDNIRGDILDISESPVISRIAKLDKGGNQNSTSKATKKNIQSADNGISDGLRNRMTEAYAKAAFQCEYRAGCTASVTTIPMFKDLNGELILPGRVITVKDTDFRKQKEMFYGYLTRMIIRGSAYGRCSGYYELTHARPTSGSALIEEGETNACYKKTN